MEVDMVGEWITYLALGGAAGLMAGLLGVGGGLIIVPALIVSFSRWGIDPEVLVHLAVGSSLASILFTSASAVAAHHRRGAVLWGVVWQLTPGILAGGLLGAWLAKGLDALWLQRVFALFVLAVGSRMLLGVQTAVGRVLPATPGMLLLGGIIGAISALVGIGGGSLTVPFLHYCRVDIRRAVATSSACGFPIALAGAVGFAVAGWGNSGLPAASTGYIYWPAVAGVALTSVVAAPVGAHLVQRLPVDTLRRVFALLLLVVGARLLYA
jgi:uncharacterized membrane protein YfcA